MPYKNLKDKRNWNHNHPETYRKSHKKLHHQARNKVIDLLGGKCVSCGNNDFRVLQIDHVNGNGLKDRLGYTGVKFYKLILKRSGIGYQCLCANCNWIKKYENHEIPNEVSRVP